MTKLFDTLTEKEVQLILKQASSPKHKLAFALGFYQGMRVSEVVKLREGDIDRGQKIIRIKQSKRGKDRNIPIAPEVLRGLKHLPVGVGARALQKTFKSAAKRAGISKDVHFHSLRHSCATHLLHVKGWDVRLVQQFLGHSKLDTTMIYTHVTPKNLVDKMWGEE